MWKFYGFSALILLQILEMFLLYCLHRREMEQMFEKRFAKTPETVKNK